MSAARNRERSALRRAVAELRFGLELKVLPPRVAWFHWRARRAAARAEDHFSLASATRPSDLAILLPLAHGRQLVAELGAGWSSSRRRDPPGPPAGLTFDVLYIDSSHERDETIAEVQAWKPSLRDRSLIVFDDSEHPRFPGLSAAVGALGLDGHRLGTLFVHEVRDAD